jgi:hypothetical protein
VLTAFQALKNDILNSGKKGKRAIRDPTMKKNGVKDDSDSDEDIDGDEEFEDAEPGDILDKGEALLEKLLVSLPSCAVMLA